MKRLEYIDAMRGLAILLVVTGHIMLSYKRQLPVCHIERSIGIASVLSDQRTFQL